MYDFFSGSQLHHTLRWGLKSRENIAVSSKLSEVKTSFDSTVADGADYLKVHGLDVGEAKKQQRVRHQIWTKRRTLTARKEARGWRPKTVHRKDCPGQARMWDNMVPYSYYCFSVLPCHALPHYHRGR